MAEEALLVVDVQHDFCVGGALEVKDGDEVVAPINDLIEQYSHVIMTQDWHPEGHLSFASQHDNRSAFETIEVSYGKQTLWPDHCVQGTRGAEFHKDLNWMKAEAIIRKGFRRDVDSYSAFYENDRVTSTGLSGYLRERGLKSITMVGLATDFCVAYSALDAVREGFEVSVILSACRGIDLDNSLDSALAEMRDAGITLAGRKCR